MRQVGIVLAAAIMAMLGMNAGTLLGKPSISRIAWAQSVEERKTEDDRFEKSLTSRVLKMDSSQLIAIASSEREGKLDRNSNVLEDKSYYNSYTFEGRAGEIVTIELISTEFDAYLILLDSEGNKIAEDDDSGEDNNAKVTIELPVTGTYQIIVNTYEAEQVGSYRLTWGAGNIFDFWETQAEREFQQGIQQARTSQFPEALQSWESALHLYQLIGDRGGEGDSLNNLGNIYSEIREYEKAINYYEQSLVIKRELGDRSGEGMTLGNLGTIFYSRGEYEKAIDYYEQSLIIARETGDRYTEGNSLGGLGFIYDSRGEYDKAIAYQQQALAIRKEMGDRLGEANSFINLGNIYQSIGEYKKAIEYHEQSLTITREIGNRSQEAQSLINLGNIASLTGEYEKAIEYHEQSLIITREIGDPSSEEKALGSLGGIYSSIGEYAKAIEYHEQSLEIAREIGDRSSEAKSWANLGAVAVLIEEYVKAIFYYEKSLAITREIGERPDEVSYLTGLGAVYDSIGEYEEAMDYHEQSLTITREIGDRAGEATSLNNLGNIASLTGKYEKAIEYYEQSLTITREIGDRVGEADSLNNLGVTLQNLDRFAEAEQQLLAAVEIWESIRADLGDNDANKVSIFEQQASTYQSLQKVLIAQNNTTQALEASERGRTRTFVELLYRRLNPDDRDPQIAPPNLAQIQQIAKEQKATLVEYSLIFDLFDLDDKPGKESAKEFALYIWVVSPTGEVTFRQADLTPLWKDENLSLWELVQTTRDSIGVRGFDNRTLNVRLASNASRLTEEEALQRLHQLLIEPIADILPQNPADRVIFMPQSSLFLTPFPALKDQNGTYLIEKHTILTAPSIQTLDLTRQQKRENNRKDRVLIVGNPTMPSVPKDFGEEPSPLASLPGAEREAKAIADLLDTQPLIGDNARKSAIVAQMENADIIHLATHGLLDDIRGMGSAIALAPDRNFTPKIGQTNGLLTAEEIFDMNLKADLVVLSACDTGRGRITGDGVIGLSRSFVSAGVPSILVSLWQVPDAPTAELMSEFYRQWEENPDKAQALRQAMLKIMKTHPAPRNWAAFTLIGEAF